LVEKKESYGRWTRWSIDSNYKKNKNK
jgi:hypothetical protein